MTDDEGTMIGFGIDRSARARSRREERRMDEEKADGS